MKYEGLKAFLAAQKAGQVRMSFDQVAKAAKVKLPASAYRYPAWWSNEGRSHVQAKAWLDAGFVTEQVDMERKRLVFKRIAAGANRGVQEERQMFTHDNAKYEKHPLIGWMKGTFTIEPGYDRTRPALDPEELDAWEASIERKADLIASRLRKPR